MTLEPNINELLSPEVLVQVLERLQPRSLLVAVLVCPLWLHLAEQTPQLWTWLHLTVWPGDLDSVIPILGSPRFRGIRRLRLRSLSDHLLSALLLNQINLVEVSLLGTNVASVSPELLPLSWAFPAWTWLPPSLTRGTSVPSWLQLGGKRSRHRNSTFLGTT